MRLFEITNITGIPDKVGRALDALRDEYQREIDSDPKAAKLPFQAGDIIAHLDDDLGSQFMIRDEIGTFGSGQYDPNDQCITLWHHRISYEEFISNYSYYRKILLNVIVHEIGHMFQYKNRNKFAVGKSKTNDEINKVLSYVKPEEHKEFRYYTSFIESEMQAYTAAQSIIDYAREHNLDPVATLKRIGSFEDYLKLCKEIPQDETNNLFRNYKILYKISHTTFIKTKPAKQLYRRFLKNIYRFGQQILTKPS